ncbi:hypothetical protein DICPUDRAFT_148473 [Dictyostelium purpureum]|uniref:Uncharacterized protein n=1 Tax=Dictyostelium purpureum TaxID=5786 RepID=F0ZB78_DICPU|nr:uncharacterized protein DICPUDRAFT_148473 [Dictyostelium purpureum]EGC38795.1 hypothetical protein DICPUDRAFT_148473 [Dictyostelium purpureum]|eukprot:XP_003284689.1 hypothetical protein DICPUDRAFT_148473 [Dictyostelium purpureum]
MTINNNNDNINNNINSINLGTNNSKIPNVEDDHDIYFVDHDSRTSFHRGLVISCVFIDLRIDPKKNCVLYCKKLYSPRENQNVYHVGKTKLSLNTIEKRASFIISEFRDKYNMVTNNCYTFCYEVAIDIVDDKKKFKKNVPVTWDIFKSSKTIGSSILMDFKELDTKISEIKIKMGDSIKNFPFGDFVFQEGGFVHVNKYITPNNIDQSDYSKINNNNKNNNNNNLTIINNKDQSKNDNNNSNGDNNDSSIKNKSKHKKNTLIYKEKDKNVPDASSKYNNSQICSNLSGFSGPNNYNINTSYNYVNNQINNTPMNFTYYPNSNNSNTPNNFSKSPTINNPGNFTNIKGCPMNYSNGAGNHNMNSNNPSMNSNNPINCSNSSTSPSNPLNLTNNIYLPPMNYSNGAGIPNCNNSNTPNNIMNGFSNANSGNINSSNNLNNSNNHVDPNSYHLNHNYAIMQNGVPNNPNIHSNNHTNSNIGNNNNSGLKTSSSPSGHSNHPPTGSPPQPNSGYHSPNANTNIKVKNDNEKIKCPKCNTFYSPTGSSHSQYCSTKAELEKNSNFYNKNNKPFK